MSNPDSLKRYRPFVAALQGALDELDLHRHSITKKRATRSAP